jgi:hypothetical protein
MNMPLSATSVRQCGKPCGWAGDPGGGTRCREDGRVGIQRIACRRSSQPPVREASQKGGDDQAERQRGPNRKDEEEQHRDAEGVAGVLVGPVAGASEQVPGREGDR